MTFDTEKAYIERRLRQERDMADRATDPCAFRTHMELKRRYEQRLAALLSHQEEIRPDDGADRENSASLPLSSGPDDGAGR
ncbi:hypothetical protein [Sphingomonas colocasiae]|uniref:DUF465 domain-containing protein n=1 Tax=Sphingomonas colocasiae TaxID=1848973 RepID=A0ABS7PYQ2_9SPHN|nr:hypothetical protein [Sphingomonas colocasiae]MBY8823296.1 hypothetical protein [Sphingomonas colocasiae]MBY8826431.1 hypothetical protein [Sphingomonas colocasiae]